MPIVQITRMVLDAIINLLQTKMTNKYVLGKWTNYHFDFKKDLLLNNEIISFYINEFWNINDLKNMPDNIHMLILTRIKWDNGEFATLGYLQKLNKNDKDYYIRYLNNILEIKSDHYTSTNIKGISISYGFRKGKIEDKTNIINKAKIKYLTYYKYKLPLTYDPLSYGILLGQLDNTYFMQINKTNVAKITVSSGEHKQTNVEIFKSGELVLKYIDNYINKCSFIREIGKNKYHIIDNKVELVTTEKSVSFIKKEDSSKGRKPKKEGSKTNKDNDFLTLDIETQINKLNKITPISISIFDGINTMSFM